MRIAAGILLRSSYHKALLFGVNCLNSAFKSGNVAGLDLHKSDHAVFFGDNIYLSAFNAEIAAEYLISRFFEII